MFVSFSESNQFALLTFVLMKLWSQCEPTHLLASEKMFLVTLWAFEVCSDGNSPFIKLRRKLMSEGRSSYSFFFSWGGALWGGSRRHLQPNRLWRSCTKPIFFPLGTSWLLTGVRVTPWREPRHSPASDCARARRSTLSFRAGHFLDTVQSRLSQRISNTRALCPSASHHLLMRVAATCRQPPFPPHRHGDRRDVSGSTYA